jgi:hypothetical protein
VFGVVFVRRLREGMTWKDFRAAWYPEVGFGVPSRVIAGASLADPREIVTVGFVDADPAELDGLGARVAEAEAARHARLDEVVESTQVRTFFAIDGDHDFTGAPHPTPAEARGHPWTA